MRKNRRIARVLSMVLLVLLMTGMLSAFAAEKQDSEASPETTEQVQINGVEDLDGKTIWVQLGTTCDTYASDYEGDDAGT